MSDVFQPDQLVGGRYRVVRKIGGGGMADVYLCEDLTLGRRVAIKVLLQRLLNDPTFVERFRREAKAAAGLTSANVVGVHDWGELDDAYYIVMEYVEGETLKDLVRRQGRLSGGEAVRVGLQLLVAVAYAHRRGIIHRDIKPHNVMLDRDGNVKVMDFGIARARDSGMTEAGSVLGTAQYLAPEQAQGHQVDERSDLYSVGIVLYEMLTGTVPFKGDTAVTVALKHVNEAPLEPSQIVPGMPYALNQIVLKAIAKDRNVRYQTADEFAQDLRSAQAGGPLIAATYDPSVEQTRLMGAANGAPMVRAAEPLEENVFERGRKRSRWPAFLLVALLLLVIAGAAYGIVRVVGGGGVAVPSVVGQSTAAAIAALKDAGFTATVAGEEFSDKYAEGDVVRQAPTAGTDLRKGDTVDLYVSKGPGTLGVEDFKGWSAEEVRDWLSAEQLSGVEKTGKSAAVEKGQVYKQDPAVGAEVKRGDSVTYWVSSGVPAATVPDLAEMTQADAEAALSAAKLKIGDVTAETSTAVAAGLVIRQDPPAGVKVDRGTAVAVVISSGVPEPSPSPTPSPSETAGLVAIPNVYTMDAATAVATLEAAGFAVTVETEANAAHAPGTVISVTPDVGESASPGAHVVLVIAS